MTPLQLGELPGAFASAAFAPLNRPIAVSATPAKRTLFIVLPQAVVTGALLRSCDTVHACNDLSLREQGNRYGLRHRFIKK
jgi:hypothetical protein